jgi:hypothetical protein
MKLNIHKPSDKQIGNVRVSDKVFYKVEGFAKKKKVSNQVVVRAILEQVIDTIEV